MVNYWVVRAGRRGDSIEQIVEERSLIGINWQAVGNLRAFNRGDFDSLQVAVEQADPTEKRSRLSAGILNNFAYEIAERDIVVTPISSKRKVLIGRVTGDYQHNTDPEHHLLANTRSVEWLRTDVTYDNSPIPLNAELAVWDANPYKDRIDHLIQAEIRGPQFGGTQPNGHDVTPATIAQRRNPDEHDEGPVAGRMTDLSEGIALRNQRSLRHDELVQAFARAFEQVLPDYSRMRESTYDFAAQTSSGVALAEMKTLDGTGEDERRQARAAVGQLFYYERFDIPHDYASQPVNKIAVFNGTPRSAHTTWMEGLEIAVVWQDGQGRFVCSARSNELLARVGIPPFNEAT